MRRMRFVQRALLRTAAAATVLSLWAVAATAALAQTTATVSINQGSLSSHECSTAEFHFVITGLNNPGATPDNVPPVSISVTFQLPGGGQVTKNIPLDTITGGVAHYTITIGPGLDQIPAGSLIVSVADAVVGVPPGGSFSGNFNLSHGPCPAVIPEVPLAAIYPAVGAASFAVIYGLHRLRRRRSSPAAAA